MKFEIVDKDLELFEKWNKEHSCKYHNNPDDPMPHLGAIGGRLTFSFTPTSIGVMGGVECACGEKLPLVEMI